MTRLALALAVLAVVPIQARAAPRPVVTPEGIVLDGVPEIPPRIVETLGRYQQSRSASLVEWAPGGGMLVATRFADTTQLHLVASPGAARKQLTFFAEPVGTGAFDPASGGDGLYFRMDEGGGEFHQYYWLDFASGAHRLLTDGRSRNDSLKVSNAGRRAAFVSTKRNGTDFDLYLVENGRTTLARELSGSWSVLDWSHDDTSLLIERTVSANDSVLHVLDLAGGAMTRLAPTEGVTAALGTARFSRRDGRVLVTSDEWSEWKQLVAMDPDTREVELLTPDVEWDVESFTVSRDGAWLAFVTNESGRSGLWLARAETPREAARIALPTGIVSGLEFDRESTRLGFTLGLATAPSDAWSIELPQSPASERAARRGERRSARASGPSAPTPTRWTESEIGQLDARAMVAPELVTYRTFDGRTISAWYYRPAGNDRHPVLIDIHGGPEGQARPWFNPQTQYLVSELGLAVLYPNVRGSSGYGKSWLKLDNGMLREDSVRDIGALLDWIEQQPELDARRVGVAGGSYGGYMVLASLAHFGGRIRCGVDAVGIGNFVTFLENTQGYRRDLRRVEYGDERDPEMRRFLETISPANHPDRIRSPLLVAQGANDPRVPVSEAEQVVKAVRGQDGVAWYVLATDEGHGFQKKRNRDLLQAAIVHFYETHLLPGRVTGAVTAGVSPAAPAGS